MRWSVPLIPRWHPSGMQFIFRIMTGGVASPRTRVPLPRKAVAGTLNHRLMAGLPPG